MSVEGSKSKEFFSGVAVVIAALVRDRDEPVLAAGILAGYGIDLADFEGVDEYDLAPIQKLYRTESQLENRTAKRKKR